MVIVLVSHCLIDCIVTPSADCGSNGQTKAHILPSLQILALVEFFLMEKRFEFLLFLMGIILLNNLNLYWGCG